MSTEKAKYSYNTVIFATHNEYAFVGVSLSISNLWEESI